MADVDGEVDQHGQEVEELEAEIVDENDGQGDLDGHGRVLDGLLKQARDAGLGDAPQARTLKHIRKALRGVRAQVEAAEERGRQRALAEFQAGNAEAVDALKQAVRAELQEETARERSLARLGIGPDSPVRQLFDGVQGDHKAFERHADLLHAAGVHWGDADPLVRQVAQQRVHAWQQQAAEQNGQVPLDPAAGVPAAVREQVIAEAVASMHGAQAGGEPPRAPDLAGDIQKAARDPGALSREEIEGLAGRFNRELDGLAHYLGAGGPL